MEEPVKTILHNGMTIEIYVDTDPMNPRTEFDNLGTMICEHRRYDMGDKHPNYNHKDYLSWDAYISAVEKAEGPIVWLPIYMYDHSGQTIKTTPFGDPWDSGQLGFIYVPYTKIRKEYGWKVINQKRIKEIKKYLEGEVETYDQYITGDVYGYVVKNAAGKNVHSCWGFFGDKDSGIMEDAKSEADSYVETAAKKHSDKLKAQIKAKVPFNKRMAFQP